MQRSADGLGAVHQHLDLHRGRQHRLQARQGGLDPVHGLDDIGARLARDHQVDPGLVAGPGLDIGVFRAIHHPGHVLQAHWRAVLVGHDQLAVLLGMEQLVVGGQGGDARGAVQCALGQVEAGLLDRQADVGQGQADGRQLVRRGLDADGRALLTGDVDLADPVDLAELPGQQGLGVVAQFGPGHLRGTDAEDQHRAVRRVDLLPGR